jgi:CRP/FNR family transcriptional regulator
MLEVVQRQTVSAADDYPPCAAALGHVITKCERCDARSHNVCGAIETKDLDRLASIAVTTTVASGRSFIDEGDPAEHFFTVSVGTAKLFKLLPDGRRQITGFAGLGDFLGLAVSSTYAFSAEAIDNVQICRYSRAKLRTLLEDFPAMKLRLLEMASNELVAAQEQMLLLGRKSARERVASFLIARLAVAQQHPGHATPPTNAVDLPMVRVDIADYLGLTIETVCRTLTRLKREGLIAIPSATRIILCKPAALRRLATGLD